MTPKELEIATKELEERIDRLRNLYEQYFLGFERLEPTVPRKDVDRRFALLRKEQMRNTAMRFRFNMLTQKYNTYAMHWVRICRQIEEGTYKRHLNRAKARFGDLASAPEREVSIDIDMADFDMDADVDAMIADANAALLGPEPAPPESARPPPSQGTFQSHRPPHAGGRTEPAPPPTGSVAPPPSQRPARPAVLPAGSRPRLILRKREEGQPAGPMRTPGEPFRPTPERATLLEPAPGSERSLGRRPIGPPGAPGGPQIRPVGSGGRLPVAPPASVPGPATSLAAGPPAAGPPPAAPDQPRGRPPLPPPSNPRFRVAPESSPKLMAPPRRAPMASAPEKDADPEPPKGRPPGALPPPPLSSPQLPPPIKKK